MATSGTEFPKSTPESEYQPIPPARNIPVKTKEKPSTTQKIIMVFRDVRDWFADILPHKITPEFWRHHKVVGEWKKVSQPQTFFPASKKFDSATLVETIRNYQPEIRSRKEVEAKVKWQDKGAFVLYRDIVRGEPRLHATVAFTNPDGTKSVGTRLISEEEERDPKTMLDNLQGWAKARDKSIELEFQPFILPPVANPPRRNQEASTEETPPRPPSRVLPEEEVEVIEIAPHSALKLTHEPFKNQLNSIEKYAAELLKIEAFQTHIINEIKNPETKQMVLGNNENFNEEVAAIRANEFANDELNTTSTNMSILEVLTRLYVDNNQPNFDKTPKEVRDLLVKILNEQLTLEYKKKDMYLGDSGNQLSKQAANQCTVRIEALERLKADVKGEPEAVKVAAGASAPEKRESVSGPSPYQPIMDKIDGIKQQLSQLESKNDFEGLQAKIILLNEQIALYQKLVDKGFDSSTNLSRVQNLEELRGRLISQRDQIRPPETKAMNARVTATDRETIFIESASILNNAFIWNNEEIKRVILEKFGLKENGDVIDGQINTPFLKRFFEMLNNANTSKSEIATMIPEQKQYILELIKSLNLTQYLQ